MIFLIHNLSLFINTTRKLYYGNSAAHWVYFRFRSLCQNNLHEIIFVALPTTFSSIIIIPQATWITALFSLTDFQCPSNQLTGADARESLVEIHAYSSTILNNTEFVSHCWNDWGQKARPNLGMFCEPPFEQWDNLSTTMPIYQYLSTAREK